MAGLVILLCVMPFIEIHAHCSLQPRSIHISSFSTPLNNRVSSFTCSMLIYGVNCVTTTVYQIFCCTSHGDTVNEYSQLKLPRLYLSTDRAYMLLVIHSTDHGREHKQIKCYMRSG